MIVKFTESKLKNPKVLNLYNFLKKNIINAKILSFSGDISAKGIPAGTCIVNLEKDKNNNKAINKLFVTFDNNGSLFGPALASLNNEDAISYNFFKNSEGEIFYSNGEYYTGEIKAFSKHGKGSYIYSNGIIATGNFVNDVKEGKFVLEFTDGYSSNVNFVNGQINDHLSKPLADNIQFDAIYKNGKIIESEYTLKTNEGTILFVMKKNYGLPFYTVEGKCDIYFNGALIYKGEVVKGQKSGHGTYYYNDGSKYTGQFYADYKDGKGALIDKDGKIIKKGYWENGEFVKPFENDKNKNNKNLTTSVSKTTDNKTDKQSIKQTDIKNIIDLKLALTNIENNIVGQEKAINQITNNILLSMLCEKEANKPLTSIILTGPTGVGKTETAKQISENIFNKPPFVIDFANFYGEHMLASLIGAPSGYKGYDETPEFIKYIDENQETGGVLLFEEIDKADPECLNIFMRILDEGEIISAKNEPYSVKNFIILATTNMSAHHSNVMGFNNDKENSLKDGLVKAQTGMKKEQLARFSLVVEYEDLTNEAKQTLCKKAIDSTIKKINKIEGYNIKIEYDESIVEKIVNKSNKSLGVREIKNQASKAITTKLAEFIRHNTAKNILVKINSLDDVVITKLTESETEEKAF